MGYNLKIGEAKAEVHLEDRHAYVTVEFVDGAPLGAPLDSSGPSTRLNTIFPGYVVWYSFCQAVGLEQVFYAGALGYSHIRPWGEGELKYDGLLSTRCEPLTADHLAAFEAARARWRACGGPVAGDVDWNLRRLDWLCWWTRWALETCKYPSFALG